MGEFSVGMDFSGERWILLEKKFLMRNFLGGDFPWREKVDFSALFEK